MKFYYAPNSRAITVHWMLEELGLEYQLEVLNLENHDNLKPEYLQINPMGKVPALAYKGEFLTEAAAICTFLADEFPEKKLNIPAGHPGRGNYLRWLFYAPSCIEPAVVDTMFKRGGEAPPGSLGYGTLDRVLNMITLQLEKTHFIAGPEFTAADVVAGGTILWGQMVGVLPKDRWQAYTDRLHQRAAMGRVFQLSSEKAAELAGKSG